MKHRTRTAPIGALLAVSMCLAGVCLAPGQARAQVALVVGNAAYAGAARMPGCEMSANLAAAALIRAGFRVAQLTNPSNARLGAAIATLGDQAAELTAPRAVIYYCGAVASYSDRLFLLPVEARLERETDVLTQGIVARSALSAVAGRAGAGLLMLDVSVREGTDLAPAVEALPRPADRAHAGLAVAAIAPGGDQVAGPLASGLADMLRGGSVELGRALADLPTAPGLARARLVVVKAPTGTAWLAGGPPEATPAPSTTAAGVPAAPTAPATPATPVAAAALATLTTADIRRVQLALQRLGYYKGRVDARLAADSEAAIRQFQRESNEDATGRLTEAQARRLLDH